MRIIKLEEFRLLPSGTLYLDYSKERGMYEAALQRKGDTLDSDFYSSTVCSEVDCDDSNDEDFFLDRAEADSSISIPLHFETFCRDGLYEKDKLFAVYEEVDVKNLLDVIASSYETIKGEIK